MPYVYFQGNLGQNYFYSIRGHEKVEIVRYKFGEKDIFSELLMTHIAYTYLLTHANCFAVHFYRVAQNFSVVKL